jgi:hypothetical protein
MKSLIKKAKTKNIIGFFVLLSIILLLFISNFYSIKKRQNTIIKSHKYTICFTVGITSTSNSKFINCKYFVGGVEYETSDNYKDGVIVKGGYYYIKFSPDNPEISMVQWDMPVPKNITKAPPEGWDYPPELIPPSQK